MRLPSPLLLLLPTLILVGPGCGHPATEKECEQIFRRSAELELRGQNVTDPAEVQRRVEEARAAKGDALLKGCIGKRITDEAMQCVLDADSAERLDECLK